MEAFPSKRLHLVDDRVHVFFVVEPTDDGVEFELDTEVFAPVSDLEKSADVVTGSSPDRDIGLFVEGVAGDSKDIDVSTVFCQKGFVYKTSVRND